MFLESEPLEKKSGAGPAPKKEPDEPESDPLEKKIRTLSRSQKRARRPYELAKGYSRRGGGGC